MLLETSKITASNSGIGFGRFAPALLLAFILLGLLCLPSLLFVWLNRDVPHFGILQDDGVYSYRRQTARRGVRVSDTEPAIPAI